MAWWSDTLLSSTKDGFAGSGWFMSRPARTRYGPTEQAFNRSFIVGTISELRYLESVRGYVKTLWLSYSLCMIFKVSLAE